MKISKRGVERFNLLKRKSHYLLPDERVLEDFWESVVANRVLRGDYTKLIPNEGGLLNTKEPVGESDKFHIDTTEILQNPFPPPPPEINRGRFLR